METSAQQRLAEQDALIAQLVRENREMRKAIDFANRDALLEMSDKVAASRVGESNWIRARLAAVEWVFKARDDARAGIRALLALHNDEQRHGTCSCSRPANSCAEFQIARRHSGFIRAQEDERREWREAALDREEVLRKQRAAPGRREEPEQ